MQRFSGSEDSYFKLQTQMSNVAFEEFSSDIMLNTCHSSVLIIRISIPEFQGILKKKFSLPMFQYRTHFCVFWEGCIIDFFMCTFKCRAALCPLSLSSFSFNPSLYLSIHLSLSQSLFLGVRRHWLQSVRFVLRCFDSIRALHLPFFTKNAIGQKHEQRSNEEGEQNYPHNPPH